MKRKILRIVLLHMLAWFVLGIAFFFLSDPIVKWIFPGIYDVGQWLDILFILEVFLFIVIILSMIIRIVRAKKKTAVDRIIDQRQ